MRQTISINICLLLVVTLLVICATPGSSPALTRTQARRDLSQGAGGAVAAKRASDEAKRLSDEGSEHSLKAAITRYEEALQLYRNIGDRGSEGSTLNNVGFVYQSLGENQKALEYYNQALPVLREAGDRSGEARTLSNIGLIHSNLGDMQKALDVIANERPIFLPAIGAVATSSSTSRGFQKTSHWLSACEKLVNVMDVLRDRSPLPGCFKIPL